MRDEGGCVCRCGITGETKGKPNDPNVHIRLWVWGEVGETKQFECTHPACWWWERWEKPSDSNAHSLLWGQRDLTEEGFERPCSDWSQSLADNPRLAAFLGQQQPVDSFVLGKTRVFINELYLIFCLNYVEYDVHAVVNKRLLCILG